MIDEAFDDDAAIVDSLAFITSVSDTIPAAKPYTVPRQHQMITYRINAFMPRPLAPHAGAQLFIASGSLSSALSFCREELPRKRDGVPAIVRQRLPGRARLSLSLQIFIMLPSYGF